MFKQILTIFLMVSSCLSTAQQKDVPAGVPLTVGYTDSIRSSFLNETRRINISLPPGYFTDSLKRYPVIYLLDGGVQEDFLHVAGIVRYFTTPWVNRFSAAIVVGIESTDRRRDFTYPVKNLDFLASMGYEKSTFRTNGSSRKFISFIESELQPYIARNYMTSGHRTIIGESLAGLLATEILLTRPVLFDNYIIINPSLWWDDRSLIKNVSPELAKPQVVKRNVYVGTSSWREDMAMFNDVEKLANELKTYNTDNIKVYFDHIQSETHATMIHQAVYNAFKLLYPAPAVPK